MAIISDIRRLLFFTKCPLMNCSLTKLAIFTSVATVILGSAFLQGGTIINFNVTAQSSALGYTGGSSYSFSVTVAGNFPSNGNSSFSLAQNYWSEDDNGAGFQLITAIAGSGMSGVFTRPMTTPSYIVLNPDFQIPGSDLLQLGVGRVGGADELGLAIDGGASPVANIAFAMLQSSSDFSTVASYAEPSAVLNTAAGTHSPTGFNVVEIYTTSGSSIKFNINDFTIVSVPEPTGCAILVSLSTLSLIVRRRI
ncbi:MAG: hypothetical protein EOP85_05725 [Verrucomicrobiaceae bacterium]|nr:MAG: hypothetical protein EOP85_05725 [Verrucomicrobiaceae bacterium]